MAYSYVRYTGNGTTASYTFPFQYINSDHVQVRVNGVAAIFSFLNANTVTITPAPAVDAVIEIKRVTPKDNVPVNFTDGSVLLERDLDLLATFDLYIAQEAADAVEDTISVDSIGRWDAQGKRLGNLAAPLTDDEAVTLGKLVYEYPAVEAVAQHVAAVNIVGSDLGVATGQSTDLGLITESAEETPGQSTSRIVVVAENIDDVILVAENMTSVQGALTSAANAATSATAAAGSATAAAGSATSASSSAAAASTSQTAAATSATNAASSATAAAGSATTASSAAATATTQASNAASSATSASTSATNAASSATAASVSASDAAASAASTAALLDSFDDRYLGPKSSAPTVDNDGNALVTGALYFDTTTGKMRVYTSTGWVDASASSQAALTKFKFVATAGQTTFSGTDLNGRTLAYLAGGEVVALNGSVLVGDGDDYTASNGTSVVLTSGATVGDTLEVFAFSSFSIASLNGSAVVDGSITPDKLISPFDLGVLP